MEEKTSGEVICFSSAKGGTGKTVLAVSAAYMLASAGRRVLLIDSDFSTRGLSIFLLAGVLGTNRERFEEKNCLVESFLQEISPEKVEPVEISRDGVAYRVILSNQDLWLESIPDDRVLGVGEAGSAIGSKTYYLYLERLCRHLRGQFDHILIDTRGGYDFTSAAPAVVADKVVVIIEDNLVTKHQFLGLIQSVREFSDTVDAKLRVAGVVINKSVASPSEQKNRRSAERNYGYPVLSIIPADLHLILSYQDCRIPLEQFPECDFSRYASEAITKLVAPAKEWTGKQGDEAAKRFLRHAKLIEDKATARQLVDDVAQYLPHLQSILIIFVLALFLHYVIGGLSSKWFVSAIGVFALVAGGLELTRSVRMWPFNNLSRLGRAAAFAAAMLLWIGLGFSIRSARDEVALSDERAAQKERAYEALFTSIEALSDRGVRLTDAARIMHDIPPVFGSDTILDAERRAWSNEAVYVWVVVPLIAANDKAVTAERLDSIIRTREWSKFYALRAHLVSDIDEKVKYNRIAVDLNNREVGRSGKRSPVASNNLAWSLLNAHKARIAKNEPADPKRLLEAFDFVQRAIVFDDLAIARDDNGEALRFVRAGFYDTKGEICAMLADLQYPREEGASWRDESISAYEMAVITTSIPSEKKEFQASLMRQRNAAGR